MSDLHHVSKFAERRRRNNIWRSVVTFVAALVVFCTTYALILPAITMETEGLSCGMEAHTHTEECCQLTCGKQEYFSHTHTEECYEEEELICPLEERTIHHHTDACYSSAQPICGLSQCEPHAHSEGCYGLQNVLICGQSACEPHAHGEGCYTDGALTCTLEETAGHTHTEECYEEQQALTCTLEETEGHTHTEECYPSDFEPKLICEQEDIPEHRHTEECYIRTCEKEAHIHTDECVSTPEAFLQNQNVINPNVEAGVPKVDWADPAAAEEEGYYLICGSQEEDHIHSQDCYLLSEDLVDWSDPDSAEAAGYVLLCQEENEEHTHTEDCYAFAGSLEQMGVSLFAAPRTINENTVADLTPYLTKVSATKPVYNSNTDSFESSFQFDFTISNGEAGLNAYNYEFVLKDIVVPDKLLDTDRPLYDKGGTQRGTYQYVYNAATRQYSAILNFYHDYVETSKEIIGYVKLDGSYGDAAYNQNDGINIVFKEGASLTFTPENIQFPQGAKDFDLFSSKTGSYTYNSDEKKLTYTVLLYSNKSTPSPLSFTDTLTPNGLEITGQTVSVKIGDYGENGAQNLSEYTGEGIPTFSTENGNIISSSSTFPGLEAGKCYVLTYEYQIAEIQELDYSYSPSNSISASGQSGNQKVSTNNQNNSINISNSYSLAKSGQFASDKINWTITVNSSNQNIAGMDISDPMFSQAIGGIVTVDPEGGASWSSDGKLLFTPLDNEENKQSYTITYSTSVTPTWKEQSMTNEVTLSKDGTQVKEPVSSNVVTYSEGSIEKVLESNTDYSATNPYITMNWKVNLGVPTGGIPRGTTVLERTDDDNKWSNHTIDSSTLVLKWADGPALAKGVDYSIALYDYYDNIQYNNPMNSGDKAPYMVITFLKDIVPGEGQTSLQISYSTVATQTNEPGSDATTILYRNRAISEGKVGEASLNYRYPVLPRAWKKDGNDQTGDTNASDDGKMTWKIQVRTGASCDTKTITVKDTLPNRVSIDTSQSDYLTVQVTDPNWFTYTVPIGENGTISYIGKDYSQNDIIDISGIYSGNQLNLSISKSDGTAFAADMWINVTCKCIIDDTLMEETEEGSNPISFTNQADVEFDGQKINANPLTQTQKWQKKVNTPATEKHISKGRSLNGDGTRFDYTVYINCNENGVIQNNPIAGDTLNVVDTLSYKRGNDRVDFFLMPAQVILKDYTTGNPIPRTDWTWSAEDNADQITGDWTLVTKTLRLTVPNKPLILTYSYRFVANNLSSDKVIEFYDVSNNVSLTGYEDETATDQMQFGSWQLSGTEAGLAAPNSFSLTKVDSENSGILLGGAKFLAEVYEKNVETQTWGWKPYGKEYITDETYGMITVKKDDGYAFNTLYRVYESEPPDKYEYLNGVVPTYYFYFKNTDTSIVPGVANLPEASVLSSLGAVDLMVDSGAGIIAKNHKIPTTSIFLSKTWKDGCCPSTGASVTFKLYRVPEGTAFDLDNLGDLQSVATVTHDFTAADPDWSHTFENLDVKNSAGVDWVYFIKEEEIPTFVPNYTNNGGIKSGEISIENEKTVVVSLPETGGAGTKVFTAAGLALVLGAGFGLMKKRRRGDAD